MKIIIICISVCILAANSFAQKQTFDLATFTPPKGWEKKAGKEAIQLSKQDATKGTYCLITLYKAIPGIADAKNNFDAAWSTLVKEMVTVSTAPEMQAPATENGWETQSGYAPFESDGNKGIAMLVTASSAEKMVNMIILTNTDVYEKEMTAFIESISLKKLETPPASQPEDSQQSTNTKNEKIALIGKWSKTSTSNSNYEVSNGLHQYHKMQYDFKSNGTYNFLYRSFSYLPDIYFAKENGTYIIQGNSITIIPQTSVFETWSKGTVIDANGKVAYVDKLGKLKSSQKRILEKVTYQFTTHYFSGINEWSLVLQYNKQTVRDGPYNGGSSFTNAWLYGPAKFPIEIK